MKNNRFCSLSLSNTPPNLKRWVIKTSLYLVFSLPAYHLSQRKINCISHRLELSMIICAQIVNLIIYCIYDCLVPLLCCRYQLVSWSFCLTHFGGIYWKNPKMLLYSGQVLKSSSRLFFILN